MVVIGFMLQKYYSWDESLFVLVMMSMNQCLTRRTALPIVNSRHDRRMMLKVESFTRTHYLTLISSLFLMASYFKSLSRRWCLLQNRWMASIHNSAFQSMMYNVFTVHINHSYITIKTLLPLTQSWVACVSVWRFTYETMQVTDVNIVL